MAINYALAANGGTLTGNNTYGSGPGTDYDITWANQDDTDPRYDGNGLHNWTAGTPDNLDVNLSATTVVSSVVLWFSDFDSRVSDPGPTDISAVGAAADFTISTWNGSSWDVQATITGNDKLTRTIAIADVATTKIRFAWTTDVGYAFVGLQEIEVLGTRGPDGHAQGTSSANAIGFQAVKTTTGSAAGVATGAGEGTGIFPEAPVTWNSADKDAGITLSNGGTTASAASSAFGLEVRATKTRDRGKWYFEIELSPGVGGYVGLANSSRTRSGSVWYAPSFNGGMMMYAKSTGYVLSREYVNQGSGVPRLFRFAVDFEAARLWIGDERGWRDSGAGFTQNGPETGVSATLAGTEIGYASMAPVYASHETPGTNKAVLRVRHSDFRYQAPAGFLPWDDYLNIGLAKGSASGSCVATWRSRLGVAAAQGSGLAQGESTRLIAAVGVATGVGTAAAAPPRVVGVATGTATVAGFGRPTKYNSVASAAGASTADASIIRARVGVGSAAGIAIPYVHSPMREIDATPTATTVDGSPYTTNEYTLRDGVTEFGGGANYQAYWAQTTDGTHRTATITYTWASDKRINGIAIYSSAWCDVRFIGSNPDGTETFPADTGGATTIRIEYDTTGGSVYADVLPIIYGNDKIRREVVFPEWLDTRRIRVTATSDSSYIRLQELDVFTPTILYWVETADVAVETSTLLAVYGVEFESSAVATDTLIGTGYAKLESVGQATSTEVSTWTSGGVGAASSKATVSGKTRLEAVLVSSGAATAAVTTARPLEFVSEGMFFTKLSGDVTHVEESTGDAVDVVQSEKSVTRTEESTGVANATVIGIRRVTIVEVSNGGSVASDTSSGSSVITLSSLGQAVSLAVHSSVQSVTLESIGSAEETLPAPFLGSYPIFWTNSISAGAATWTGLPFNSFIEADGVVYAAGPSGVFELDDESGDLGVDVPSEIEWDLTDGGSVQMKRMRSVYVNARAPSPFTVRVANEQGVFDYATTAVDTDTVTNHRAAVGRGVVSRNVRLSLLHTKHYVAEDAGVGVMESKRRI